MAISLQDYSKFLDSVRIPIRLAFRTSSGWPLVLSLWYLHENGRLLCATRRTAKVVGHLELDPRCGFEIAEDRSPYCGVRGQARVTIREEGAVDILKRLLLRYEGSLDTRLARTLLANSEDEVALVLEPTWITTWDFRKRMSEPDSGEKNCP